AARDSFENWIATRSATGQAQQDAELLSRTRNLDALNASERARQMQVEAIDARALAARQALAQAQEQRRDLDREAGQQLRQALFRHELRVFGFRLALTLPLLAV